MTAIFPTLPGLDIAILRRPKWSTLRAIAASGRDVRIALWSAPLWEWELTFNFLRDTTAPSELATLVGFYNEMAGALTGFLFRDPDDHTVTAQALGTGDGVTTQFTVVRSFGAGTEPVGFLDDGAPINVYLDGVLQTTGFALDQSNPVAQSVIFTPAPDSAVAVSVDCSYYFYVHFKDDQNDFERFLWQIYQVRKIVLESLRG